ncbi:MAG TPA: polysaccharide deacetylase family protein [Spirochaetota bacterium]|nr:polysaccharide deacetylase family protein [Spirochaetota bacterium]
MKSIYILIVSLAFSLVTALFFYLDDYNDFSRGRMTWLHKDRETQSRLLTIPIILYHNIDGKGPFSIDAETLKAHFQMIRDRGIRVIPLRELTRKLENPAPYREKAVAITFDDGYGSMYTKLLPLVREFGYPVTLFVYTDIISLKSSKNLTWRRLRAMDRQGIDIQAHSITHRDLTRLSKKKNDPEVRKQLYEELYLSKRILELYLNKKIELFAYPYGKYDLTIIDLTAKAGYRRAFSTDYGSNIITRDNFCLRRQHIKSSYTMSYFDSIIQ